MSEIQNTNKEGIMRKVTEYLFGRKGTDEDSKNSIDNDYLAMRTDIQGKEVFNALAYYGLMETTLGSKVSKDIRRIIQLQAISLRRQGRAEGVKTVESGQFPQVEKLLQGYERKIKSDDTE